MKQRKTRSDSITGQIDKYNAVKLSVEVPAGESLRNQEQRDLWDQYTSARPADTWREIDLLEIIEMIHLKILMRNQLKSIIKDGVMIEQFAIKKSEYEGEPGEVVRIGIYENPAVSSLRQTKRLHLAIKSSMSLGIKGNDAVALNAGGESAMDKAVEAERQAQGSLLAH